MPIWKMRNMQSCLMFTLHEPVIAREWEMQMTKF